MFKPFQVTLPLVAILLLQALLLLPTAKSECIDVSNPSTLVYKSLKDFQANKKILDPQNQMFEGNNIKLAESAIPTIPKNSFIARDSEHIRRISLENHQIQLIEDEAFSSLKCVAVLNLRRNKIANISIHMFEGFHVLLELDLGENMLSEIPDCAFQLVGRLQKLNITSNRIKVLHRDSFHFLTGLEELDLSYNHLSRIPPHMFDSVPKLVNLQLGSNTIEEIDVEKWNLTQLKILNLSDNALKSFDLSNAFTFSSSLLELYIDDNYLTSLNHFSLRKYLPVLKTIDISENFWMCEDLIPILKVLNDSHINYRGPEDTDHNIGGIGCNKSEEEYSKKARFDTETTAATVISSTNSPDADTDLEKKLYLVNTEIFNRAETIERVTISLLVLVIIFMLYDFIVRTGCANYVITRCRRRQFVLDNFDGENISLMEERY